MSNEIPLCPVHGERIAPAEEGCEMCDVRWLLATDSAEDHDESMADLRRLLENHGRKKLTRAEISKTVERLEGPVGDRIRREAGIRD